MDEKEAEAFVRMLMERASPVYLNPGPELYGKFMVCRDFQVVSVFDTEEAAMAYAADEEPGSIEIRHVFETDDGVATRVIIPGAIQFRGD